MKRNTIMTLLGIFAFATLGTAQAAPADKESEGTSLNPKVEVYYFHYSRRCASCINVEKTTKEIIEAAYASQMEKGELVFGSVNLDDPESRALAERCGATGQSILVVSGDQRFDLTSQGFMNARNPDRYGQEIKKVIDPLLK